MTKVAAVQMCSTHELRENLNVVADYIREAAKNGAKLVVLPENFALMGRQESDKLTIKEVFGKGEVQDQLSKLAKDHHVWIVAGTFPIATQAENKVRATSLVFNDQGWCVARYDKMHLFDVSVSENEHYHESEWIEAGERIVDVATPFGKLGLGICYDVRFPELFRSLFLRGVEIIILPSAFTVKTGKAHWEVLVRSRAIENFCYVIAAAQGGHHTNGRNTYGHSLIVDPRAR